MTRNIGMVPAILLAAFLCLVMVFPYLPGRFDASAETFSLAVQVASYMGLLMVPVGLAWIVAERHSRLWRRLALMLCVLIAFAITIAAVGANQLAIGVLLAAVAVILLRSAYRRPKVNADNLSRWRHLLPFYLIGVPLVLFAFRAIVIPRAADWSRDRAIRHSVALIAQIESFRERRGHYPVSLESQHPDFPTGVVGIERFHYEPNGEGYNLFFVRRHIALDAEEIVVFNSRDEHHFTAHALDILQYDGEQLELRRGDRRRTRLAQPNWISILLD